jgi:hypothetical protein
MDFVSRAEWGARFAAGSGARPIPTSEAWLHHSATLTLPVDAAFEAECEQMRRVEAIGQQRFGAGFSYNLAGFPSGRMYVGCGVRRIGTHTGGRNTRALGIVLIGDYSANSVPDPLREALVECMRFAHAQGWTDRPAFDGGHRDLKATACPGEHAYRLIPTINDRAGRPPAPPAPPPPPAGPLPPVRPEHLGDSMARLIKSADRPHVFATDGVRKWHIPEHQVLVELRATGMYGEQIHEVSRATIERMPDA